MSEESGEFPLEGSAHLPSFLKLFTASPYLPDEKTEISFFGDIASFESDYHFSPEDLLESIPGAAEEEPRGRHALLETHLLTTSMYNTDISILSTNTQV